jgi:hypothetical protein
MVQGLPERSATSQRVEKKLVNKLAQRRLRRKGKGHAKADKEKAMLIIASTLRNHFGPAWESRFSISIRSKRQLGKTK